MADSKHQRTPLPTYAEIEAQERVRREADTVRKARRGLETFYKRHHGNTADEHRRRHSTSPLKRRRTQDFQEWLKNRPYLRTADLIQHESIVTLSLAERRAKRSLAKHAQRVGMDRALVDQERWKLQHKQRAPSGHDVDFGLRVPADTMGKIRRVVCDLLFDRDIRDMLQQPQFGGDAGDAAALQTLREQYVLWCGRVYALVIRERERDNNDLVATSSRRRQRRTERPRYHGKVSRVAASEVTIAALYTRCEGYTMHGQTALLSPDDALRRVMPRTADLVWFGVDHAICREYINSNTRPQPRVCKYNERMVSVGRPLLQQTFDNYKTGPEELRRVLAYG